MRKLLAVFAVGAISVFSLPVANAQPGRGGPPGGRGPGSGPRGGPSEERSQDAPWSGFRGGPRDGSGPRGARPEREIDMESRMERFRERIAELRGHEPEEKTDVDRERQFRQKPAEPSRRNRGAQRARSKDRGVSRGSGRGDVRRRSAPSRNSVGKRGATAWHRDAPHARMAHKRRKHENVAHRDVRGPRGADRMRDGKRRSHRKAAGNRSGRGRAGEKRPGRGAKAAMHRNGPKAKGHSRGGRAAGHRGKLESGRGVHSRRRPVGSRMGHGPESAHRGGGRRIEHGGRGDHGPDHRRGR